MLAAGKLSTKDDDVPTTFPALIFIRPPPPNWGIGPASDDAQLEINSPGRRKEGIEICGG